MRCPKDNVIGGVNNGWKVAMTTLGFERGTSSTTGHRRFQKEFDEILERGAPRGRDSDPLIRQRLARSWSKIKIMQINGFRTLTDVLNGTHTTAALGACNKMFWSEAHQDTHAAGHGHPAAWTARSCRATTGEDTLLPGARRAKASYPVNNLQSLFFFSRSETIWGGAAEIQRNIVGERALGLPKEPKPPLGRVGLGLRLLRNREADEAGGTTAERPARAGGDEDRQPPLRVMVVDGHSVFAESLAIAIEATNELTCVGTATASRGATSLAEQLGARRRGDGRPGRRERSASASSWSVTPSCACSS